MNRIQNQISTVKAESETQSALQVAKERQENKEKSGYYRWITIRKRNNLRLLCKCGKKGKLLPQELERIKRVRQTLNIKDNE